MKSLRTFFTIALACISIFLLSACGNSFAYNEDEAIKRAQNLIETVNGQDYTAAANMLPEGLQSQISAEKLQDTWGPLISTAGTFSEYEKITTRGMTQSDVNYIVVVVPCKYENDTLTFTITYTTDLKIAALELK